VSEVLRKVRSINWTATDRLFFSIEKWNARKTMRHGSFVSRFPPNKAHKMPGEKNFDKQEGITLLLPHITAEVYAWNPL